jgi:hypothetical protein
LEKTLTKYGELERLAVSEKIGVAHVTMNRIQQGAEVMQYMNNSEERNVNGRKLKLQVMFEHPEVCPLITLDLCKILQSVLERHPNVNDCDL